MTDIYPFDKLATEYDDTFTYTQLGKSLRAAVWSRIDACFLPGQRILELGCGTGEDAIFLGKRGVKVLATDNSALMVEIARQKVKQTGLNKLLRIEQFAMEKLYRNRKIFDRELELENVLFDGVLSNFGGLNCVSNLAAFGKGLAECLRPRAKAVFCLMGAVVPWEWFWFLIRGQPSKAFRRLQRKGIGWHGMTIHYPFIHTVIRAFRQNFRLTRLSGLGFLLPPTYAEPFMAKYPRLLSALNSIEREFEMVPPFPWLADHFLIEFDRI